ncbi:RnfH family protein [Kushneria phosphatilytica]|uniref:UPF0125 protein FY550_14415 n=1 Tax=Kushneria phosphatilytica TaxID=657387 RepID=A0A1S1NW50_9GAMM|nr:RnfH family protein [Kushneria phosphatilytica]OHV11217.1 hypothetical protein BH688_07805 [Kushneria phosphatilytica]QEL12211.1 RnfH family protein [Kushneria phosphatilytica]
MDAERITIELAYAEPADQQVMALEVIPGTTVLEAFESSGLRIRFATLAETPAVELDFGIFGEPVPDPASRVVQPGDRIEIYRPLRRDPKQARRARARHQR